MPVVIGDLAVKLGEAPAKFGKDIASEIRQVIASIFQDTGQLPTQLRNALGQDDTVFGEQAEPGSPVLYAQPREAGARDARSALPVAPAI
jgi:hypothetical protein